ncbi:MAG TPA: hypothetical protein DDW78_07205 [Treponema sp.]|nr:hypothetical protein [Treponema sp.]
MTMPGRPFSGKAGFYGWLRPCIGAAAKGFCCLVAGLLAMFSAGAQEIQFSGDAETLLGVALPYTDNAWDFVVAQLKLNGVIDVFADESTLHVSAGGIFDGLQGQSTDDVLSVTAGDGAFSARLKEAYFDYNGGIWSVRLGRQISAWGKADGLTVTDILCPKDMTNLFAGDYSDSSLGIDALRVSLNLMSFVCDAYWIPVFTPSSLPLAEGNPLRKVLLPSSVSSNGFTLDIALGDLVKPELELQNGEYALKLAAYLPFADFSAYAFYGWDDVPVMTYALTDASGKKLDFSNPMQFLLLPTAQVRVGGEYKRMAMFGADAAVPAGPFTIRLEGAFFPQRYFATTAEKQIAAQVNVSVEDSFVQRNQLALMAGLDWMPGSWTLTAQYYLDAVLGDLDDIDREERVAHKATLSVSRSFLGGNLELSAQGILGLNDFDAAVIPSVSYALSDQISLSLSGNFFIPGPDNDGEYGAYKDLSSVTFSGKFSF